MKVLIVHLTLAPPNVVELLHFVFLALCYLRKNVIKRYDIKALQIH